MIHAKKKIIILGSSGMIGHMIYHFIKKFEIFLIYNVAGSRKVDSKTKIIDVQYFDKIEKYINEIKPDFIINCIGLLIDKSNKEIGEAIYLNALFPQLLNNLSTNLNYKLIHISTDCVFSGKKGKSYLELDEKDGLGNYSKTKALGEIINDKNLTLRTSVIGPELKDDGEELFNWFMLQDKEINGFTNVFWSGVSSIELAKAVMWGINNNITGLYNITNGQKISKNDLLSIINKYSSKKITINSVTSSFSDKSLIDTRKEINYSIPSYELMVKELFEHINNNNDLYPHYNIK